MKNEELHPSVLGGVFCLTFTVLYFFVRKFFGYDTNLILLFQICLLYFFIAYQISYISKFSSLKHYARHILFLLIIIEPLLGYFFPKIAQSIFNIGGVLALGYFSSKLKFKHLIYYFYTILIAIIYFLYLNTYYSDWTGVYTTFLNRELAELGILHKDVFHIASIIAMINKFEVASTGVHGLIEIITYSSTYWWIAAIVKIYNGSALEIFGLVSTILILPLTVFTLINSSLNKLGIKNFYFILIAAFLLIDSISYFRVINNIDFALSLIIFCYLLPNLVVKRALNTENIFELVIILIIAAICFNVKPHTSTFILVCVITSIICSFKKFPVVFLIGIAAIGVATLFLIPQGSIFDIYLKQFNPFSFETAFPATCIFYIATFLCILFLFFESRKSKSRFDMILLILLFLFSASFLILRGAPDGNAHYFSFLMTLTGTYLIANKFSNTNFNKYYLIIIVGLSALFVYRLNNDIKIINSKIVEAKNEKTNMSTINKINLVLNKYQQDNFFVYIKPQEQLLWAPVKECSSKPFLFPALFEVPRVFGMTPANICRMYKEGYGFNNLHDARSVEVSDAVLCDFSKQFEINKILELSYQTESDIKDRLINCLVN